MRQRIYFLSGLSWGLNEIIYGKWLTQFQHTELQNSLDISYINVYVYQHHSIRNQKRRVCVSLVGCLQHQKSMGRRTSEMTVLSRGCHRWILQAFKFKIQNPQINVLIICWHFLPGFALAMAVSHTLMILKAWLTPVLLYQGTAYILVTRHYPLITVICCKSNF